MNPKTRFCPTLELERTGVPTRGSSTSLKLTLVPAIDGIGNKAKPTIIESDIIGISTSDTERVVYNGITGALGELMIFHNDSSGNSVVSINRKGELIIATKDDDPLLYSRSQESHSGGLGQDLIYELS